MSDLSIVQNTKKGKIVTTVTIEKIERTEIPENYENKSKEDGKNGEKSDGKQDTEEEKIITTENPEKNGGNKNASKV